MYPIRVIVSAHLVPLSLITAIILSLYRWWRLFLFISRQQYQSFGLKAKYLTFLHYIQFLSHLCWFPAFLSFFLFFFTFVNVFPYILKCCFIYVLISAYYFLWLLVLHILFLLLVSHFHGGFICKFLNMYFFPPCPNVCFDFRLFTLLYCFVFKFVFIPY